jgi:hypothetical protein
MPEQILILVHPGSLCGSANMNLGKADARAVREEIASELDQWIGGLVVLDGMLSDELPDYPVINDAIEECLDRCATSSITTRLEADDPDHAQIALDYLRQHETPTDTKIVITGAWYEPDWSCGCVNLTFAVLRKAGFTNLHISDCAASCSDELAETHDVEKGASMMTSRSSFLKPR